MNTMPTTKTDYLPPVKLNAVMRASAVGKIVASKCPKRKVGQAVSRLIFSLVTYSVSSPDRKLIVVVVVVMLVYV